jgi:hypothetical protein
MRDAADTAVVVINVQSRLIPPKAVLSQLCRQGNSVPVIGLSPIVTRAERTLPASFPIEVSIPIKPAQLHDALIRSLGDDAVAAPRSASSTTQFDPDTAKRHPLTILLAEDNAVNQKVAPAHACTTRLPRRCRRQWP